MEDHNAIARRTSFLLLLRITLFELRQTHGAIRTRSSFRRCPFFGLAKSVSVIVV